jgi:hypothetical protein
MGAGGIGEEIIAGIQPGLSRLGQERRAGIMVKIAHERGEYAVVWRLRQNANHKENVFMQGVAGGKLHFQNEACEDIVF